MRLLNGFKIIEPLKKELTEILEMNGMSNVSELTGKSLEYFGTMAEMPQRMDESRQKTKAHTDHFQGDNIVDVSNELTL